ncbi:PAK4-inhibitor INKA2 isoform X1 [Silurus asotus]|uniref:PAK4-inhibitor INKA2 n=1 Tax=Silurus asotus TaxID=30991 RepID=A0AAD5AUC8_SILAS|nr:PAK4-inhibitor INKA2 isoform X1 [Silurus asotus]
MFINRARQSALSNSSEEAISRQSIVPHFQHITRGRECNRRIKHRADAGKCQGPCIVQEDAGFNQEKSCKQDTELFKSDHSESQKASLSMKEAGDGLHAQMNSMMGALQELKLLQVQTALEQLEITGKKNAVAPPPGKSIQCSFEPQDQPQKLSELPGQVQFHHLHHSSVGTSPSTSSLESEGMPLPRNISGYTAQQVEYCGPKLCQTPTDHQSIHPQSSRLTPVDLSGILYSLSREGPSLDSDYTEDSMDDSSDWTSSLMSRSRNRQPLVLGDNVLADLVGNWLDLPEVDKDCVEGGMDINRPDSPADPPYLSQSQELCKRFSLTSNIFKKFLRSVRPDRDKLLKEKPGWMPPGHDSETELFKRPKKISKAKGGIYLQFWARGGQQSKSRPCPQPAEENDQLLGLYLDRRPTDAVEKDQPLLDYNTVVWV